MLVARGSVDVASPSLGPASIAPQAFGAGDDSFDGAAARTGGSMDQSRQRTGTGTGSMSMSMSMSAAARERLVVLSLPASIHASARLLKMLGPLDSLLWWEEAAGESPGGERAAVAASAAAFHRAAEAEDEIESSRKSSSAS